MAQPLRSWEKLFTFLTSAQYLSLVFSCTEHVLVALAWWWMVGISVDSSFFFLRKVLSNQHVGIGLPIKFLGKAVFGPWLKYLFFLTVFNQFLTYLIQFFKSKYQYSWFYCWNKVIHFLWLNRVQQLLHLLCGHFPLQHLSPFVWILHLGGL